jgi:hypothetical protein
MKSYFPAALGAVLACVGMQAFSGVAMAAQPADDAQARAEQSRADEAAGLPDLAQINRPAAEVSSKVDINSVTRTPSFHEKSANGTEITEYRDKGKPVEIDVHSSLGTNYQMSASPDTSPKVRDNLMPSSRYPSLSLHY